MADRPYPLASLAGAAVCEAAMRELGARMATGVASVRGKRGDPAAAGRRLGAIGSAYLEFAREEPGLFATAFALPQQHAYGASKDGSGEDWRPLAQLRRRSTCSAAVTATGTT